MGLSAQHFRGTFDSAGGSFVCDAPGVGDVAIAFNNAGVGAYWNGGEATPSSNDNRGRDYSCAPVNPVTSTSLTALMAGETTRTLDVSFSILTCDDSGGDDGIAHRDTRAVQFDAAGAVQTYTPPDVVNPAKCVAFVDGVVAGASSRNLAIISAVAEIDRSTGEVTVTAGEVASTPSVRVTVLEFTGASWTVESGAADGFATSKTVTLSGSVAAWANTLIVGGMWLGTPGADTPAGSVTAKVSPGAALNEVGFAHAAGVTGETDHRYVAYAIHNPNWTVHRFTDNSTASESTIDITAVGLAALSEALVFGSTAEGSTAANNVRGGDLWELSSLTTVTRKSGRTSPQSPDREVQVVTLPTATLPAREATLASTLDPPAFAGAADVAVAAQMGAGLEAPTYAGSAEAAVAGQIAATLSPPVYAGAVGVQIEGQVAAALEAPAYAGLADVAVAAQMGVALEAPSYAGAAEAAVAGQIVATLSPPVFAGAVGVQIGGQVAAGLDAPTYAGSADVAVAAQMGVALEAPSYVGAAEAAVAGGLSAALDPPSYSGAVSVSDARSAQLAAALQAPVYAGSAEVLAAGQLAVALAAPVYSGALAVGDTRTAQLVATLEAPAYAGAADVAVAAQMAAPILPPVYAGAAEVSVAGQMAVALDPPVYAGALALFEGRFAAGADSRLAGALTSSRRSGEGGPYR